MADFMLSYASAERRMATEVADALRGQGRTVWMDAAVRDRAGRALPGIPGGQQHWQTICAAIDESATFLILETSAWHRSDYCLRELDHARRMGKRMVAINPPEQPPEGVHVEPVAVHMRRSLGQLGQLVDDLVAGDEIARAHARLLVELTSAGEARTTRAQIRDAELLATGDLESAGIDATSEMAERIAQLLRAGRQTRRRLGAAATTVLVALLALTVVALTARSTANGSRSLAQAKADYSLALSMAQQSRDANSTNAAIDLARRSTALVSNDATESALRMAESDAYRATTRIAAGTPGAAAVSHDGLTALITQYRDLYTVRPAAGEATLNEVMAGATRTIAISPTGGMGFVVDMEGILNCVDTATAEVTPTPNHSVIALSMSPDGVLWWLTQDGRLYGAAAEQCPMSPAAAAATGVYDTSKILVDGAMSRLFTLSSAGAVGTYDLPPAGQPLGVPISRILISEVPVEGREFGSSTPDSRGPSSLSRCGDVIHVVQRYRHMLSASSHIALTLDGAVIGARSAQLMLHGVGCAPGGTAWGVPELDVQARAFPASASHPAGEVDERDRGSRVVIANSSDGGQTVVVHPDGRVNVLSVSEARWSQGAGQAIVATVLPTGVLTVDADGAITAVVNGVRRDLQSVGEEPLLNTVALRDRAIIGSGDQIFALNETGVLASARMPGQIISFHFASGDGTVLVVGDGFVSARGSDLRERWALDELPTLPDGEQISSVTANSGYLVLGTSHGRVLVMSGEEILATADTGVGGATFVRTLPNHEIVVAGASGRLSRYSPDLELLQSRFFGPSAAFLDQAAGGETLLLALSGNYSVWAVDAATLEPISEVAMMVPDARRVGLTADGLTAVTLSPPQNDLGDVAQVVVTHLDRDSPS